MLTVNYTVFKGKNKAAAKDQEPISEAQVEEIRAVSIHSLLNKIHSDFQVEYHLGAT